MLELLEPLHPKLVHFPIALFVVASGLEVVNLVIKKEFLHQCALLLFTLAALITPIVVRTGMMEVEKIGLNHPILDDHRQYALISMWVSLLSLPILWFLNREFKKLVKPVFIIILLVVVGCVSFAGHKGGEMVYEYGVGVEI